ncbi:MAG: hypothetical protein BRC30_02825 [Nanohaloarchaea archaeon SW_7_46_7]|nr:MAG: hypothetical protein BRC30_02825 [Nanohaloarchaea archaeon SW_7_46_7]
MKFQIYNPEEDDYLWEDFEEVLEKPVGVEKYREVIEEALSDAKEVLGRENDLEIVFGLTDPEKIREKWGEDAGTNFHVYGFTFGSWFDGFDRDFIFLYANDSKDDWRPALKNMTVHEGSHIDFYSHYSDEELSERLNGSNYNSVLFEGHSTNSARKVDEVKGYSWNPSFRTLGNDFDHEKIMDELEKERPESSFFDHGGEEWQNAEGYPASFEIFHWIIKEKGLEVEELPKLSEEKTRELVDEAVEQLYS